MSRAARFEVVPELLADAYREARKVAHPDRRFHFKQWGSHDEHGIPMHKKVAGRLLDGRTWDEYPVLDGRTEYPVLDERMVEHP